MTWPHTPWVSGSPCPFPHLPPIVQPLYLGFCSTPSTENCFGKQPEWPPDCQTQRTPCALCLVWPLNCPWPWRYIVLEIRFLVYVPFSANCFYISTSVSPLSFCSALWRCMYRFCLEWWMIALISMCSVTSQLILSCLRVIEIGHCVFLITLTWQHIDSGPNQCPLPSILLFLLYSLILSIPPAQSLKVSLTFPGPLANITCQALPLSCCH